MNYTIIYIIYLKTLNYSTEHYIKNIIYGIKNPPTRENILKLLEDLDLSDIKDSFSKSMDNKVGFYGNKLSGGQRQNCLVIKIIL